MKTSAFLKILACVLFVSVTLSGCYMPIRFDAEIEITRGGYYDFKFDGYVARIELFKGLKEGTINPEEERKQAALIKRDFGRDNSVKEFKYLKMGHFKVKWERKGDILKTKSVSFFNPTSEYMLGIRFNSKTSRISMSGKSLKNDTKKKLDKLGLGWTGKIRVFTDAGVISHNATKVQDSKTKGGKFKVYMWDIKSIFAPTPSLILQAG
ncbi:MAG: hypothetical protein HQ512_08670 [Rhodospirillales bacterium]|nr:hypothetical protein [Rhodospirillales bacterium]